MLELGGKDPMIVCADADLDNAVAGAIWGGFANAGQTCSGIERVYVLREVADRFLEGVAREAERMRVGDPLEWETEIGPMTSAGQYETVVELVDDAVAAGASKLCGGPTEVAGLSGQVHRPGRPHRRHPRDADHARGDLRAGPADRRRRLRAGGDRARQRLRVRPRRLGLDPRPPARRADRPAASSRGWSGSTTTPSATAPASAPGAGSRTPASAARTRNSASMSASTSR